MIVKRFGRTIALALAAVLAVSLFQAVEAAGNIDPNGKYAWGTNIGYINFNPTFGGVTVCNDHLEGYAWSENIGWIRLGTFSGCGAHTYSNTSPTDYGVNKDSVGNLTGSAWSTNAGWINFSPTGGGVKITLISGSFDGYAWGENVGWIHFKSTGAFPYNVIEKLSTIFTPAIYQKGTIGLILPIS